MVRFRKEGIFTTWTMITVPLIFAGSSCRLSLWRARIGGYSYPCMPAVRARTGPFFFPFMTVIGIRISGPSDPAGTFIKPDFISPDEEVTSPTFNVL